MLVAVDIGNSSTKFGLFEGDDLVSRFFIETSRTAGAAYVSDEVAGRLNEAVDTAIVASVVPEMDQPVREYLQLEYNIAPIFVEHDFDFGLTVNYEPITAAGIDRLVNASAAAAKYGTPCIVCSFGTATTIDLVSRGREYRGGIIAPGMQTMAKALHMAASKLPEVEIERPDSLLGNSTVGSIRSGIYYGYIEMVEGLIERISQVEASIPSIVATGGFASVVAEESRTIKIVDENLTLDGLRMLFEKQNS